MAFFMKLLSLALFAAIAFSPMAGAGEKRVVAYVPNWIDLQAFSKTIDYKKVTHLNIAFENPTNETGDLSWNKKNDALVAESRKQGVKILLSIGGGSASTDEVLKARYADLLGEGKRAAFAAKLGEVVAKRQLDGIDVDIEGPAIDGNYGAFIDELAKVLKPRGKLLTAALSKGYGGDRVPDSALAQFDFLNIMAYDATGSWKPDVPGQHSSVAFAKNCVNYWIGRGLPKDKAVLGVPFYGYGFGAAFKNGGYSFANIVADHPGSENLDQTCDAIWYNGIPTIKEKTRYVVDEDLGGIMIWSLNSDAKDALSLLAAIHSTLIENKK